MNVIIIINFINNKKFKLKKKNIIIIINIYIL